MIWQESRFQPGVVGPRTRSGERAQGIAQFMPRTAAERGLLDPFDPVQALPKSAEFLRELADQFGNLGLAAAAYNAGPQRVRDWLSGARTLPAETRNYVLAITGLSADEWARSGKREPVQPPRPNCTQLMALLHRAPNPFVREARGAGEPRGRQPVGRAARAGFSRDHALANYADAGQALCRGARPAATRACSAACSAAAAPGRSTRCGSAPKRAQAADSLCGSIRRAGGACIVLRNGAS